MHKSQRRIVTKSLRRFTEPKVEVKRAGRMVSITVTERLHKNLHEKFAHKQLEFVIIDGKVVVKRQITLRF